MRTAISAAHDRDVPNLIGVRDDYLAHHENWAGDMAYAVSADQVEERCKRAIVTD